MAEQPMGQRMPEMEWRMQQTKWRMKHIQETTI